MRFFHPRTLLAAVTLLAPLAAADITDPLDSDPECTITSPHTESFYDLRPLRRFPAHTPPHHDWHVKGQDYHSNFTLNICAPIISNLTTLSNPAQPPLPDTIAAFYTHENITYSIGAVSRKPVFRGRKLVLQYDDGSACPDAPEGYTKSTVMSLMCDHEAFAHPAVSFIAQVKECTYFFEVRTAAACATVKEQNLGPVAVFGVIMGVAAMVYLIGGCVYQRTVMHARGWRQIPHWQVWAAAAGFIWNMLRAISSAVVNKLSGRRSPVLTSYSTPSSASRNRRNVDVEENQLIDELDDDWGDDQY